MAAVCCMGCMGCIGLQGSGTERVCCISVLYSTRDFDLATMVGVGLLGRWKSIYMPQGVYPGVWKCISYLLPTMVARSKSRVLYKTVIQHTRSVPEPCKPIQPIQPIQHTAVIQPIHHTAPYTTPLAAAEGDGGGVSVRVARAERVRGGVTIWKCGLCCGWAELKGRRINDL